MRRRIELNLKLARAAIPGRVMQELCAHALSAAPEECCGLVLGTADDPFASVRRITNVMTKMHLSDPVAFPRDSHQAYYMAEGEILRVTSEAETRGEEVTAVYHSHVGSGAYLSEEDLAFAEHPLFPFPKAAQLVVSVLNDSIEETALFTFDLEAERFDRSGGRKIQVVES